MRLSAWCLAAPLLFVPFFPALCKAQGSLQSQVQLSVVPMGAGQESFPIEVIPGASVTTPFRAPGGTVTLYSGTSVVGSPAALTDNSGFTTATFAQVFGTPDATLAASAGNAAWGDFNGDGVADLLVYGAHNQAGQQELIAQVFLGKKGLVPESPLSLASFTPAAVQQLAIPFSNGETIAVLDVDGDGHLDLLAGNMVAYGNGDGTFGRVAALPALASGYNQTYAVDIDGDGKTDIVAVDTPPSTLTPGTVQYAFTVFHNEGGGSFATMGPYPLAPSFAAGSSVFYNIFGLSFADVNGDGRIDVISQSNNVPAGNAAEPASLNVMLNLGTGFGAPQTIDTSTIAGEGAVSIAFADLNHDGKQDLVFSYQANTLNNGVATLLSNGDGTFAAPVNFTIGSTLASGSPLLPLIAEDVNGDGRVDVVLGSGVLLAGNGDGTLTAGTPLFTSTVVPGNPPPAYTVIAAPANSPIPGGETAVLPPLVFTNLQSGANAVFVPLVGSTATITAMLAPGTYSLTAHYSGDATYAASVSGTLNLKVGPYKSTVTVTSSANPAYAGENVTFTATITGTLSNPLSGATGTMAFSDGSTALGTVPVSGGSASYTTSFSSTGSHTITAAYSGDSNDAAASATITQAVDAPVAIGSADGGTTSLTVAAGQAVTTQVTAKGNAGFSGTATFSCTGLPQYAACSFSPSSVSVSSNATAITMTVSTAAGATASARETAPLRAATVVACGLPLVGLLMLLPVARGRRLLLCVGFVLFLSTTSLTGCGGGSSEPKTAPGSYTFQVVATSGSATSSASYTLKVQ